MHQFDLRNRTAIITGGAQGLGLGIAKRFIESGAEVIIWDIDKRLIKEAKQELNSNKLTLQIVDVTNFEDIKTNIDAIIINKKVDIFVNNAGVTGLTTGLWDYPIDEWHKVLNVNLNGTFYCCKAIVPHMIKNNYGRIVNVASVAGKDGNANASAYSSAKAAVIGLTKSLGKELANKNIAVNVVTPASAKTRILDQMSKEHVQFMFSKIPRKRFLEMNEFASLVTWLSSEENSFSTAAVFDISGGRSTY
jgi:3-oxoacyl-[acyl-carrier protein] reductase